MKKTITLTGDDALAAQSMIAEARVKWPILSGATDEEVLTILVGYSLARGGAGMKIHFEHKSTVFDLERKPMPPERFTALCKLAGAVIGGLLLVALVRMVGVLAIVLEVVALLLVGLYKIIPKFDD